ncbi:MAG: beta-lactamase family protein [Acidobacteria bacterium]|nr:beta-lactamase family protein [Acidobacteriota bacterium]
MRGDSALKHTTTTSANLPAASFDDQDRVFAKAFAVLEQGITERAFPGASVAVTHEGKLVALKGLGRFTYESESPRVCAETVFDLASVSKVVATTAMAMILYERGQLDLEAPVAGIIPEFASDDARRRTVTLRMLLAHSSGLPAYQRLFEKAPTRDALLRAAFALPLEADPATRAEYSDIGFMVLGEALERIAGVGLDSFCRREVFGPLGMAHTTFRPPAAWKQQIPPTVDDRDFRRRIVQGEVHDENASVLGGVAGHAGVFAPAADVATFAHVMLSGRAPVLRPETVALFTRRQTSPAGTSRALGWDTPRSPSQSGQHFSARSFGHLGYTGTSLWIDPERRLSVTLLTNRTWPDRSSQRIKQVRPQFHDAIVEALR